MDADEYRRAVDVPPIRGHKIRRGRHVEREEIDALFRACDSSPRGRRDRAMLALLFGLGLRRSELVGLDVDDIGLAAGTVAIRHAKGGRERVEYLPRGLPSVLEAWLQVRGVEPGPLLNPVRGRHVDAGRLTAQSVYDSVRRVFRRTDVEPFSPHDCRRTLIANLLDAGIDIVTVAKTVGHAQVTTTARYDRRGDRTLREASRRVQLPLDAGSTN